MAKRTTRKKKLKNPAAVALGRKGGKKSRAYMTQEEASLLGKRAVMARWQKVTKAMKQKSKSQPEGD